MYPLVRFGLKMIEARGQGPLDLTGWHCTRLRIWPWDLDPWRELNNGRTLTLFDLGRIPMSVRMGFETVAKARGWGITVAGSTVRYRRRITLMQVVECHSRILGWDDRFAYVEQSLWRRGDCCTHMLLRYAFPSRSGLVAPGEVMAALGHTGPAPALPDWARAWIAAEAARPWPPDRASLA